MKMAPPRGGTTGPSLARGSDVSRARPNCVVVNDPLIATVPLIRMVGIPTVEGTVSTHRHPLEPSKAFEALGFTLHGGKWVAPPHHSVQTMVEADILHARLAVRAD